MRSHATSSFANSPSEESGIVGFSRLVSILTNENNEDSGCEDVLWLDIGWKSEPVVWVWELTLITSSDSLTSSFSSPVRVALACTNIGTSQGLGLTSIQFTRRHCITRWEDLLDATIEAAEATGMSRQVSLL